MWQELLVGVIVVCAALALMSRARSLLVGKPKKSGAPSCHGCDDCGEEPTVERRPVS